MLLNRKKGKDAAVQYRNEVQNTTSTPVPIKQRRGKKPPALTKLGTLLRFINAFFHQQMREHTGQLKNRMNIQDLDKRKKIPHSNVWEAIEKFYGEYPNEELDAIPTTVGKTNVYESFKVEASSPSDFDKMNAEDLYLLHAYLMKRYNVCHRNFKQSGSHGHFDDFIGRDWLVSPAIYYFYLRLTECGNDTHKSQATNILPDGLLMESITDESGSAKKKRKAVSPMTDYKNRTLNTKDKLAQSFVEIGYQRKRDNDRKDSMEVENSRLRKLEVEKTLNEQFTFLLRTSTELKRQLLEVDKEEEEFIKSMLEANKKSLARIVKELNKE